MYQVSPDEFAGMGPSIRDFFSKENKEKANSAMAEAMEIISNPELHNKNLKSAKQLPATPTSVKCRIYDLSNTKQRAAYEKDLLHIVSSGTALLLDRGKKQFVQTDSSYKYVTYLEWAEYALDKPKDSK